MKAIAIAFALLLIAAGVGGGYWLGARHAGDASHAAHTHESTPASEKKILYYRNPMGLADTSPVPKKDPMGMDYIPVYEGEDAPTGNEIRISTEKVQRLGVRTEAASRRALTRTVRAVGTLQIDERRVTTVTPKFEGWIERLHVNTTGQAVARGQPLMEVYSPDLVTAQQEYLIAVKGIEEVKDASPEIQRSMRQLMSSALDRLRNWDISDQELAELQRSGAVRRTVTLRSPSSGIVVEKPAVQGMRFMPGEKLYQISDLSALWLLADIFEQDLALVRAGQPAAIEVNAFPGRSFKGRVAFLYPTVTPETRTGKVRIELANPGGLLKPAMYASVELAAGEARKVLAVPASAVLDSGARRVVLVQAGEGRFEPRDVKLGTRADDYVEVLAGVKEGEAVVVAANFLIDAESNLKAAITGFTPAQPGGSAAHGSSPPTGDHAGHGASPKTGDHAAHGASSKTTDHAGHGASPATVGHRAQGTVQAIDAKAGTVMLAHGPVPTLGWSAMTMPFVLANPSLAARVKPGAAVSIEFVERKPGEYVITKIEPQPKAAAGGR
jgi:Cu(I)/Ag(I) efflux system membrane fusion protein